MPIASGPPIDREKLKTAREAKKLSQTDLAKLVGIKPQMIQKLEMSGGGSRWLHEIATALDRDPQWLVVDGFVPGVEHNQFLRAVEVTKYATYKGTVAGGMWLDKSIDEEPPPRIPADPNEKYAGLPQVAFRIVGLSMDLVARPGRYLICLEPGERVRRLREGQIVVVSRRKGELTERSAREVRYGPKGEVELHYRSSDPRFSEVLVMSSQESEHGVDGAPTLEGIAIGIYEPLPDPLP